MAEMTRVTSLAELDPLFATSHDRPVFLFKHSLTCPVSGAAFAAYRRFVAAPAGEEAVYALIEVQRAREVCDRVAALTGLRHESPQVILLRDGEPVWHASHGAIDAAALRRAAGGSPTGAAPA